MDNVGFWKKETNSGRSALGHELPDEARPPLDRCSFDSGLGGAKQMQMMSLDGQANFFDEIDKIYRLIRCSERT